jgi:hypothetical protein
MWTLNFNSLNMEEIHSALKLYDITWNYALLEVTYFRGLITFPTAIVVLHHQMKLNGTVQSVLIDIPVIPKLHSLRFFHLP